MSLSDKSVLLICDSVAMHERCANALGPALGRRLVVAHDFKGAQLKFENQAFDYILLALSAPALKEHWTFFKATQKKTAQRRATPWILVAEGVEGEDVVAGQGHAIKFAPKDWKQAELITLIENLFAHEKSGEKQSPIDVQFINPFLEAVSSVLSSMCQITVKAGAPAVRKSSESPGSKGDISGLISVASENFSGSMAIILPRKLALGIYQNMLGETKTELDAEVKDCIMELTNIVFGNAKRDLNQVGHSIRPAIPNVITGEGHEVRHSQDGIVLSVPFSSDFGNFVLECFVSMHQPSAA